MSRYSCSTFSNLSRIILCILLPALFVDVHAFGSAAIAPTILSKSEEKQVQQLPASIENSSGSSNLISSKEGGPSTLSIEGEPAKLLFEELLRTGAESFSCANGVLSLRNESLVCVRSTSCDDTSLNELKFKDASDHALCNAPSVYTCKIQFGTGAALLQPVDQCPQNSIIGVMNAPFPSSPPTVE